MREHLSAKTERTPSPGTATEVMKRAHEEISGPVNGANGDGASSGSSAGVSSSNGGVKTEIQGSGSAVGQIFAPEKAGAAAAGAAAAGGDRRKCPYLDTINRNVLDFDFEKVCWRCFMASRSCVCPCAWIPSRLSNLLVVLYAISLICCLGLPFCCPEAAFKSMRLHASHDPTAGDRSTTTLVVLYRPRLAAARPSVSDNYLHVAPHRSRAWSSSEPGRVRVNAASGDISYVPGTVHDHSAPPSPNRAVYADALASPRFPDAMKLAVCLPARQPHHFDLDFQVGIVPPAIITSKDDGWFHVRFTL